MLKLIFSIYRKLFARGGFVKFNNFLFNCSIRGLGIYNYENMEMSGENAFINNYIKKDSLKNNSYIVFDVGANRGDYTKLILEKIPDAQIFSFEPHPITYKILSQNLIKLKKVRLFNCALSSEKGCLELYDYKSQDGSSHASLNAEVFTVAHNSETVSHKVEVSTVDLICEKNNIEKIDFLKIDVEGYELDVLKGSKYMIDNDKVKFIQFEFTQLNTTTRLYFKDFWELLANKYKIYRLLPNDLLEIKNYSPTGNEIFGYQNFVAIHKGI